MVSRNLRLLASYMTPVRWSRIDLRHHTIRPAYIYKQPRRTALRWPVSQGIPWVPKQHRPESEGIKHPLSFDFIMLGSWHREYLPTNPAVWIPFVGYFLLALDSPANLVRRSVFNAVAVSALCWGVAAYSFFLPSGYFPIGEAEQIWLVVLLLVIIFYAVASFAEPRHVIARRRTYSVERVTIKGWNFLTDLSDSEIRWMFRVVNYHEVVFFLAGLAILTYHII